MALREISLSDLQCNPFDMIGKDWYLVTAGTPDRYNTMTASWGMMGLFWGKPVAHSFIRPSRYTYEFMEQSEYFTLSFFDEGYRPQLQLCGSKSGRDIDKTAACGFTPITLGDSVSFEQARLVLVCRKLYVHDIKKEQMADPALLDWYPEEDFHRCYIGEICKVYQAK